jgi:hypothetical protein
MWKLYPLWYGLYHSNLLYKKYDKLPNETEGYKGLIMWSYESFAGWKYSQFICHIRWPMVKKTCCTLQQTKVNTSHTSQLNSLQNPSPQSTNMTDVHASKITVKSTKLHCFHVWKSAVLAGMLICNTTHIEEDSNKDTANRNGNCFLVAISIRRNSEVGWHDTHPLFAMLFVFNVSSHCQNN